MALSILGSLASQLLPMAINWGVGKLRQSNIGRGAIGKLNKGVNKTKNFLNSETGRALT